jgi:hypothetical protein
MIRSPLLFIAAILLCSGEVRCEEVTAACRPLAEPIHLAATEHRVPVLLLTALVFAESSCDPTKVNPVSGAIGAGQLLITGAGAGYAKVELLDPWRNTMIAAAYLTTWKKRCGSWRGAVAIFNGSGKCSSRTRFSAKVIREWQKMEKESERVS